MSENSLIYSTGTIYGQVNSPEWVKGDTGEKGDKGDKGDPGFSPTIDVKEDTDDTYILTITDVDGSYDTPNLKGSGGSGGSGTDGEDGGYYEPSVDSDGNLSWTASKEDMPAVDTVNIKGPAGQDGTNGQNGQDGKDGVDGYSPVATVTQTETGATISITDKTGTTTAVITNGQNGTNGQDGQDGLPALTYGKIKETTVTPTVGGVTNFIEAGDLPPSLFSRTPIVGDRFILLALRTTTGQTFILDCEITLVSTYVASKNVGVVETTGKQGEAGAPGQDGENGQPGQDGENGATFTPSVDTSGNLSWTNDKSLPNPQTVNIRGPQGEKGADGEGLPTVTTTDNGKFARVVDGVWSAVALTNAEEVFY